MILGRQRRRAVGRVIAAAMMLLATVRAEAAVRIQRGQGLDLLLMGFGVFQTDLSDELESLFDAADGFPAEFNNRQLLSARLEGRLSQPVGVEARVHYDRENLRDWRYLVRLQGERNEIAYGELDGAFRDTLLTRYDTPFYGMQATVGLGPLTTSAFSTTRDGNFRVDRLPGTNLSGPYILQASPVLEGSERVVLEIRDRRDDEEILSSDLKRPGLDYSIDYPTGTILFNRPIEERTFDGDPVLVVVEYQFAAHGGGESDEYLTGGRIALEPVKGVRLGTTFLRSTGGGGGLLGEGLLGVDQSVSLAWLTLVNEIAGPKDDLLDRERGAWHLDVEARPSERLVATARYRRVGRDYETTANPTLDSDLDRQSLGLDLSLLPHPAHRLRAGFVHKSDDVAENPELEQTVSRRYHLGWELLAPRWPVLRIRAERRTTDGPGSFGPGGARLDTYTLDVEDEVGSWPILGATSLRAQYRHERADDSDLDDERVGHYVTARLESRPSESLETYVELRAAQIDAEGAGLGDASSREILLGGRYRTSRALSLGASVRHRRDHDPDVDASESGRTSTIFDLIYEPSERLRAAVKYEWTLTEANEVDDTRTRNLFASLVVRPVDSLSFSFGYQLDDQSTVFGGVDRNENAEWFASALWERDRLTLFARAGRGRSAERLPPFEVTVVDRTIYLGGASLDLTDDWSVLGEFKDEEFTGPLEAQRRAFVAELTRRVTRHFRVGVGVELTIDEQGDADRLDRERVYLKVIGKL